MTDTQRIYLDNAATSWPKPPAVYDAVERYMRDNGAPAGRSAYAEASRTERAVEDCRLRLAQFLGTNAPQQIVFTCNGTDSLNQAIHGAVRPGDHVVTTTAEHNSVLRPLNFLEQLQVEVSYVGCDRAGYVSAQEVLAAVRPETRLVAMIHASNVTGVLQPVEAVGHELAGRETLFLVDAAQSLGHMPVNVERLGCDLLAAPAHKGLLGPLGLGVLYVRQGVESQLRSHRQGGTGTRSEDRQQPDSMPDKFESGNHNVPAIVGLSAALDFLQDTTTEKIFSEDQRLTAQLLSGLQEIAGVTLYGPAESSDRLGVVSFQIEGYDPQEVAGMLDSSARIQVRAGLHCAPEMHRSLGTLASGGTIRVSCGPFTTEADIRATLSAVREIAATAIL